MVIHVKPQGIQVRISTLLIFINVLPKIPVQEVIAAIRVQISSEDQLTGKVEITSTTYSMYNSKISVFSLS